MSGCEVCQKKRKTIQEIIKNKECNFSLEDDPYNLLTQEEQKWIDEQLAKEEGGPGAEPVDLKKEKMEEIRFELALKILKRRMGIKDNEERKKRTARRFPADKI